MTDVSSGARPDIDFRQIRPYGSPATRANAFEELVSILIRTGAVQWPKGVMFERFGNPDGGREGRGTLSSGDVWAWQAKYLFEFTSDEAGQVEKSIVRALDRDPNLKRYFVALPYDLPAGDTDVPQRALKSAHTKWLEKKAHWEALASAKGMTVDFVYIGAHDLVTQLTEEKNAGRLQYWFDAVILSPDALHQRLANVINGAGPRYSPELHVEVDAVRALDGLGRSTRYVRRVQEALAVVRKARAAGWYIPKGDKNNLKDKVKKCLEKVIAAEASIEDLLVAIRGFGALPDVSKSLEPAFKALGAVDEALYGKYLGESRYFTGQAADLHRQVSEASNALHAVQQLLASDETGAASGRLLLMSGRAGVGKTHLFCDVASNRIAAGAPTLVVLGQNFDQGSLLAQIGTLVDLEGNLDQILDVLDAAGEAAEAPAMLMVDALNEGANAERWVDDLRVLAGAIERRKHVTLAVSCRTEFLEEVVGDTANKFTNTTHYGFVEATSHAIDRYTNQYNLERLAFPILNPEFGNPLFLKLACEALATLGETRFEPSTAGMVAVCNAYIDAVNKRLAAPTRCDYDPAPNPVKAVVRELASLGPGPYARAEAARIADAAVPGRSWSRSLLNGLLREGVLMQSRSGELAFSYQRLGDVWRALTLIEGTANDIRDWYRDPDRDRWAERGTVGALAVLAPERHQIEIIDLLKDDDGRVDGDILDAFIESVVLRAPQYATDRTAALVTKLLELRDWTAETWDMLTRVACVPAHRLNADWLHEHLMSMSLTDRDTTWSEWLIHTSALGGEDAPAVLLDWAWPTQAGAGVDGDVLAKDVPRLASLAFGWMLSTPDRRVRDRATKALVAVGEREPGGFATAVGAFHGCDDPYVVERLAASLCGVALRTEDPDVLREVADAAVKLVGDNWSVHLLTRDYLRRVSRRARDAGWIGPEWLPPYGAAWPGKLLASNTIEKMTKGPEYKYSSIWSSLDPQFGDFGKYVIASSVENFNVADMKALQKRARRAIFTRAVNLGWTPERFEGLEGRVNRWGDGNPIERYGKKYQWIAYYETLGRLADTYKLRERWGDDRSPYQYDHPEQLVYRDIDSTVLVPGDIDDPVDLPWYASVEAPFPDSLAEYPTEAEGIPDPLDLIALTDPDGQQWLSLIRHASWSQVHPPEIAALNAPTLNLWIQIRGYLVPSGDISALEAWAEGKDYDGRWMSENADVHSRLLGAHPDSPDWDWANGDADQRGAREETPPTTLYQPVAEYSGTGTAREMAGPKEPAGYVPTRMLFDLLHLNRGKDFRWTDDAGLAVFDPTAGMNEASTLVMRRELVDQLAAEGYTLFWTVLLNKLRHDHDHDYTSRPGKDYRWISASASYAMKGKTIELNSTYSARLRATGGGDPQPVIWTPRTTG